jgi:small subunit ribosomal protein S20
MEKPLVLALGQLAGRQYITVFSNGCQKQESQADFSSGEQMPHTPSAKKRLRQGAKRREHNLEVTKEIKIQTKKFLRAVQGGDKAAAQQEYVACAKKLDKAAARRIIHPNKAARKKSQLARLLNAAPAPKS